MKTLLALVIALLLPTFAGANDALRFGPFYVAALDAPAVPPTALCLDGNSRLVYCSVPTEPLCYDDNTRLTLHCSQVRVRPRHSTIYWVHALTGKGLDWLSTGFAFHRGASEGNVFINAIGENTEAILGFGTLYIAAHGGGATLLDRMGHPTFAKWYSRGWLIFYGLVATWNFYQGLQAEDGARSPSALEPRKRGLSISIPIPLSFGSRR